jgi:hypothetical protein
MCPPRGVPSPSIEIVEEDRQDELGCSGREQGSEYEEDDDQTETEEESKDPSETDDEASNSPNVETRKFGRGMGKSLPDPEQVMVHRGFFDISPTEAKRKKIVISLDAAAAVEIDESFISAEKCVKLSQSVCPDHPPIFYIPQLVDRPYPFF